MRIISASAGLLIGAMLLSALAADPVKHSSGRPLPPMPSITKPVQFDTPEADKILEALQVFPTDNPWNEDISKWPVHPNSKNIIASIGPEKPFRANTDMGFVLVPPDQKKVNLLKVHYVDESDKGPFPIPDNVPLEGWPLVFKR